MTRSVLTAALLLELLWSLFHGLWTPTPHPGPACITIDTRDARGTFGVWRLGPDEGVILVRDGKPCTHAPPSTAHYQNIGCLEHPEQLSCGMKPNTRYRLCGRWSSPRAIQNLDERADAKDADIFVIERMVKRAASKKARTR